MATTIVRKYTEPLVMGPEKIRGLAQHWLESARGDEDKAGTPADAYYYEGWADAMEGLLKLMVGEGETPTQAEAPTEGRVLTVETRCATHVTEHWTLTLPSDLDSEIDLSDGGEIIELIQRGAGEGWAVCAPVTDSDVEYEQDREVESVTLAENGVETIIPVEPEYSPEQAAMMAALMNGDDMAQHMRRARTVTDTDMPR